VDDGLKQRIIGAFVLIALIVIFVPVLFDEDRLTPLDRTSRIPLEPSLQNVEIAAPVVPLEIEEEQQIEEMPEPKDAFIPDETKPQSMVAEEPGLTEEGIPLAWVLQLASFEDEDRATILRDKLLADGYDAYVREVKTNKGVMKRVYVGPKLDKETLIKEKKAIDEKYKVSAIILRH